MRDVKFQPLSFAALAASLSLLTTAPIMAENLRIGIIGLDSSHSEQFTLRLNDPANPNHVPGARIVAAYAGRSPDLPESATRVAGFTATLKDKFGVKILPTIPEVCAASDAILILSVDGRPHLEQAKDVIASGKPFFLDKPVAASLKDAVEIYKLADAAKVPMFSASATERHRYQLNAYRVLLTRARQGMVLVVPEGSAHDPTRAPAYYDETYRYFASLGLRCLD